MATEASSDTPVVGLQHAQGPVNTATPLSHGGSAPASTHSSTHSSTHISTHSSTQHATPVGGDSDSSADFGNSGIVATPAFEHHTSGTVRMFACNDSDCGDNDTRSAASGDRHDLACVSAVPSTLFHQPGRVQAWLAPVAPLIAHAIFVQEDSTKLLLLRFIDPASTTTFVQLYAGQQFSPEAPERCHIALVSHLSVVPLQFLDQHLGAMHYGPELPRCPMCLERLDDSLNPIALCFEPVPQDPDQQPVWVDHAGDCTVCQAVANSKRQQCADCGLLHDLWICLVCGYVGCSRLQYGDSNVTVAKNGHALAHWQKTKHLHGFALHLESQCIWDYNLDRYAHRVRSEPAQLQLSSGAACSSSKQQPTGLDVSLDTEAGFQKLVDNGKREAKGLEYAELLSGQLVVGQQYFNDKIMKVECDAAAKISSLETALHSLTETGKALKATFEAQKAELPACQGQAADMMGQFSNAIKALQVQRREASVQEAKHEAYRKKMTTIKVENALLVKEQQQVRQYHVCAALSAGVRLSVFAGLLRRSSCSSMCYAHVGNVRTACTLCYM